MTAVSPRLERELRHADPRSVRRQLNVRPATRSGDGGFVVNGVDYEAEVHAELDRRFQESVARMRAEIPVIGRHGERPAVCDREGGGEFRFRVHPVSFHYWGQRLGYECWEDEQFIREYLRDNEYARTRTIMPNPSVGWQPGMDAAAAYLKRSGQIFLK